MTTDRSREGFPESRRESSRNVLKRHKGKIVLVSILGVAAAMAYDLSAPPLYASQAKLMIRYILDRSAVDSVHLSSPALAGNGGDSIVQSEMEILTSWDLAKKVAELQGMEKLAPKSKESVSPAERAAIISSHLSVAAIKGSNILVVTFKHEDPKLATQALNFVIQEYFDKHLEIHRSKEGAKFVTDKVEKSRTRLRGAEDDLTKLKSESGILSAEGAVTALQGELAQLGSDRIAARIRLAGQQAHVATLERLIDEAKVAKPPVGETDAKPAASGEERMARLRGDLLTERARLAATEAELKELEKTLSSTQKNVSTLTMILPKIAQKERARDMEEANYKLMSSKLEMAAIDEALDGSKIPNISVVQEATPAALDINKRNKTALVIACGTPVAAIVFFLLLGLFFREDPKPAVTADAAAPVSADS